jgi:hypothetical protein
MFPPVDPTRRHLLTIAAGGAVAAAIPSAAVAGIPASGDPIFAAIEAHREATAVASVAYAESARLHRLANEMVGPYGIEIPNMLHRGTTVMAECVSDINEAIPRDQFPDLNEHYREQLTARNEARRKVTGDTVGWMGNQRLPRVMIAAQQLNADFMMRHRLRDQYLRIDQQQSPEQESYLALDVASPGAISDLKALAEASVREHLGKGILPNMLKHIAASPIFFNRNGGGG